MLQRDGEAATRAEKLRKCRIDINQRFDEVEYGDPKSIHEMMVVVDDLIGLMNEIWVEQQHANLGNETEEQKTSGDVTKPN